MVFAVVVFYGAYKRLGGALRQVQPESRDVGLERVGVAIGGTPVSLAL